MAIEWHFVAWCLLSLWAISATADCASGLVALLRMLSVHYARLKRRGSKNTCVPHALVGASEDEHLL